MGRGRAKAKQTKVARQLKYANHNMDLERLRQDLGVADEPVRDDETDAPNDGAGQA
ncbi:MULTISPECIES: DUF3073 domain-containing protein [Microtetraspora]|uniref:DUF3073 domain-containing protein n=1 Tax=Microtetraspora fusca TaxID=1997 RepID=A0ABW6VE40_MICFU